jgi:Tol biopolymer transport system component
MKRIFQYVLVFALFVSCANKSIQLPETDDSSITEITDVSAAYLFYDETKTDRIELNRKNLISTTNWLVNVDKRLSLKQAIPSILFLQNKKRNAKLHKNENAKNYFTCSNPNIKNLAFIEFTDVVYHEESSEDYFAKISDFNFSKNDISINFNINNEIVLFNPNSQNVILKTDRDHLGEKIAEFITLENTIYLNFKQDLSFQAYITYKSLLLKLNLDLVKISKDEFIYN